MPPPSTPNARGLLTSRCSGWMYSMSACTMGSSQRVTGSPKVIAMPGERPIISVCVTCSNAAGLPA